ncbi:MAG: RES family NAD+ phosphorylase [Bacteroidetes bacterium]|nr:RES family NAD+ phosphorylase [Bacteroidota bacterium]
MASGVANRWNRDQEYVIYTSESRSLALLEMMAHRVCIRPHDDYMLLTIQIVDALVIHVEEWGRVPDEPNMKNLHETQEVGSAWYRACASLVLRVPSVLVAQEYNYVVHANHPDFHRKVTIARCAPYLWDSRLV